jgi:pyruvate dehydrogenase E1 component beta subunit
MMSTLNGAAHITPEAVLGAANGHATVELTYTQAINEALAEEMERDERVILMGEDIGAYGGVYTITRGLQSRFGAHRVLDTPISEAGFVGAALGAAMTGLRPVVEVMWVDFTLVAMDQIVNQIAKVRYMTGGQAEAPLVIRTQHAPGGGGAAQHSQSLEVFFAHVPGLKVVMPATPADAKGLLKAAIRDPDPVMFIEHKLLYRDKGPVRVVASGDHLVPLGKAAIRRSGDDVTVVAWSGTVRLALQAAEQLAAKGISVEVIDLRTLTPLDIPAIVESVRRTNRLVITHEAATRAGFGAEIAAAVLEHAFDYLDAPIERVGAAFAPIPINGALEAAILPDAGKIAAAIQRTMSVRL